jgi:S1-C subfamily serine protease
VLLGDDKDQVNITAVLENGASAAAGIKSGDRITAIDNHTINNVTDLRLVMWDKQPGDTINVDTVRKHLLLQDKKLSYELTLQ